MDKDEQVRQIKKLLHRLDSGTNVDAGKLFENPTNTYVDPLLAEHLPANSIGGHTTQKELLWVFLNKNILVRLI